MLVRCLLALTALALVSPAWGELTMDTLRERERLMRQAVRVVHPATVGILFEDGSGAGSGVIVAEAGLVLTAAHVSGKSGRPVTVILAGGERLPGKTLGAYRSLDAGMIQIEAQDRRFPVLPLGDSDALTLGQWCLAIGHPGGFINERSAPVRLGRLLDLNANGFLITDSTLVGGDSGGPLVDLQGRLIGIHSSIGIDLAENRHVPINAFKKHWESMRAGEETGRLFDWMRRDMPFLGVVLDMEAPAKQGAVVRSVVKGSPAEEVGIKEGDRVLAIDGRPLANGSELIDRVRRKDPGDRVTLLVESDGESRELRMRLQRFRDFQDEIDPPESPERPGYLGVRLQEVDGGIVVREVVPGSPAAKADLRENDVVLALDDDDPGDIDAFVERLKSMGAGSKITLSMKRGEETVSCQVTLGARP